VVELEQLELIGGKLCLDFVNTIDPRHARPRQEFLINYDALLAWAVRAGAISTAERATLAARAAQHDQEARTVLSRAIPLREALYVLLAPGTRDDPETDTLTVLNAEVRTTMAATVVEREPSGYRLSRGPGNDLDRVLWPVVHSALEVLSSRQLHRVRECHGNGCGWLFMDVSKAGRRRWCSMTSCGNREKANRHRGRVSHP
jgi:predicted RNA-binding Zn ribbon-like protein